MHRSSDANGGSSSSPYGSPDVSAPLGQQTDILRLDSNRLEPSVSLNKSRRASISTAQDAKASSASPLTG